MKKLIYSFVLLLLINNEVIADCYTGFACSVKDLEEQEKIQTRKNINIFKKYLKKIKGKKKFNIARNNTEYNDLFVFIQTL